MRLSRATAAAMVMVASCSPGTDVASLCDTDATLVTDAFVDFERFMLIEFAAIDFKDAGSAASTLRAQASQSRSAQVRLTDLAQSTPDDDLGGFAEDLAVAHSEMAAALEEAAAATDDNDPAAFAPPINRLLEAFQVITNETVAPLDAWVSSNCPLLVPAISEELSAPG